MQSIFMAFIRAECFITTFRLLVQQQVQEHLVLSVDTDQRELQRLLCVRGVGMASNPDHTGLPKTKAHRCCLN